MNQDRFRYLYNKYLQGHCSQSEFVEIKEFFVEMRTADRLVDIELLQAMIPQDIPLNSVRSEEILDYILTSRLLREKKRVSFRFQYVAAAAIFLVGFLCFYLFHQNPIDYPMYSNTGETVQRIILSDQSSVYLQPNASITQLSNFATDDTRHIKLSGEAFFAVHKDDKKPFVINSPKGLVIRVLGTRFYANFRDRDESVILTKGSVAVKTAYDSLILKPQQMAVYRGGTNRLEQRKVDTLLFDAWLDNQLYFKEHALSEVLLQLNDVYPDAKLRIAPLFYQLSFTGYLPRNDLDRCIEILQRTFANHNLTIIKEE